MLGSGFLRGGEDVFHFQPGIRYVFFIQQTLLGESGVLTGIASVFALALGILAVADRLQSKHGIDKLAQVIGVISLVIWWSSSHTTQSAIFGLSEFGTWILLLGGFSLLLRPLSKSQLVLTSVAAGVIIWIRPNQGIAMVAVVFLANYLYRESSRRLFLDLTASLLAFAGTLALIPLHNLLYGNRFQFLPGGHLYAGQSSWDAVLHAPFDSLAREFILGQIRGIAYLPSVLPDIYSVSLGLAFIGSVLSMLLTVLGTALYQERHRWRVLALAVVCLAGQMVPFLKYTIYRYYPIHVVAVYLTAVLAMLAVSSLRDSTRNSMSLSNRS
jgi:heme/copper-type cytochrome/quinol oxidase subunit 4